MAAAAKQMPIKSVHKFEDRSALQADWGMGGLLPTGGAPILATVCEITIAILFS